MNRVFETEISDAQHVCVYGGEESVTVFGITLASDEHTLPVAVPEDELYFWTSTWQAGERAAQADFESGNFEKFSSGKEAVRWLLDSD